LTYSRLHPHYPHNTLLGFVSKYEFKVAYDLLPTILVRNQMTDIIGGEISKITFRST